MSIKSYYLILPLFFVNDLFGQCEVKSIKIDDGHIRNSMVEKFYQNEDLENGIKTVYIYVNAYKDVTIKKTVLFNLVVTYMYSSYQPALTPSRLIIKLADGSDVTIEAKEKSTNTLNLNAGLAGIKTLEGIFTVTESNVATLTGGPISQILIYDIREQHLMDITPKYKNILSEMLTCVNN